MTLEAIKEAVVHLSEAEREQFAHWFEELAEEAWDKEIERDFSGVLANSSRCPRRVLKNNGQISRVTEIGPENCRTIASSRRNEVVGACIDGQSAKNSTKTDGIG